MPASQNTVGDGPMSPGQLARASAVCGPNSFTTTLTVLAGNPPRRACSRMEPDVVVQLGYPPLRIDLLTSATGVDFESCWENRVILDVGGVEAGFISLPDLIENKRAAGRPQDLVDADVLDQHRSR